ncbi:TolC family protein [Campylobacterota bacterium DY0563]
MKKQYLLTALLPLFVNAQSVDSIVTSALEKNSSLKALESSINITKEQITLSTKWDNPVINIGATDIQFNDYRARNKEPMQSQFIGLTQAIPMGDKLQLAKEVATNDYTISKYNLENKKLELKSNIYEYAYKIKLLEERISLYKQFKLNVEKLESLLKDFYKYGKAKQKDILSVQILYNELNLKQQQLQTFLNTSYLKLEELTYKNISTIDINTDIKPIVLSKDISSHPKILSFEQTQNKFTNISKLEEEKKIPDIKMNVTYFERSQEYEDYMNVSLSFPLPVYGKESIKATKAKFQSQQVKNQLDDLKNRFYVSINTLQKNINDSIDTFKIIEKNIIPKYDELQELLESNNSFLLKTNLDTRELIKNQNDIIKYKLKAVDEKEKYFSSLAKSYYFTRIEK